MELQISVRNLVEFVLRSGDIDNRKTGSVENAMLEGSRIHRMIQKQMGPEYQAEVFLKYDYVTDAYTCVLDGRADGIITKADADGNKQVTIDEIKSTGRELKKLTEPVPVHLAQAKCYAYMFAKQQELLTVGVRMTYCQVESEELKYFEYSYEMEELENWFLGIMKEYEKWMDFESGWEKQRQTSIKQLQFPFAYREGQKDLVTYVYRTICLNRKLFIEAPTGTGKTISTIFPGIKAMGEGKVNRLFYLTAKTITRTVAENTFELLRGAGLQFKTVVLTAKEKICFMEEAKCNPVACPYANGHYDRINDAIYDLLVHENAFSRDLIEQYARKHQVCPFEMSLDMSLFSDGIICDYNYLFDPHAYLRRFFQEARKEDYLFLIDEAHNLVDRGRDMYSAVLVKEDFLELKRLVKAYQPGIANCLDRCNKEFLQWKRMCDDMLVLEDITPLVQVLNRLYSSMNTYLEEHTEGPAHEEILQFFFQLSHFLAMYELLDENYLIYCQMTPEENFMIKLLCVDPGTNLSSCMAKGRSSILFSATLLPIRYYKKLLGADAQDYEVYAKSVFDKNQKLLVIGSDVTSKYTRRNLTEYQRIAQYIHEICSRKRGNYMVFFPSHQFLQDVYEIYEEAYLDEDQVECLMQGDRMSEEQREEFLSRFEGNTDLALSELIQMDIEIEEAKTLIGFCVMGGIFSEGIDLQDDSLIGAIIVGTGLPQVGVERELLKEFFEQDGENGFDYAYRYPGMNKVLQAAGRVIRTVTDRGIIALLDERFLGSGYTRLFPREWEDYRRVTVNTVGKEVEEFWKKL